MEDLSESKVLKVSLLINLLITISAIPLLLWANWMFWTVKYTKLFHVNFKILIQIHLCGFLLHCTARTILHSIDLFNYTMVNDPCDMIPNIFRCFILRLLYNSGIWISNTTAVSLIIERWLATKRSVTYEKDSVLIGVLLAVMQITVAAILVGLVYVTFRFDTVLYYCITAQASLPYTPQLSATLGISIQVAARIAFHFLYSHNEHLQSSTFHSTLSNRYQLEQNINSISCLKTLTNLSSVYVILQNASYIIIVAFARSMLPEHFYTLIESLCVFPTYAIITVIVMTRDVSHVRKRIEIQFVGHLKTSQDYYFESFKKQIA